MGLDMYLYKKTFVFDIKDVIDKNGNSIPNINLDKIRYIQEEIGYWRKANHIHKWFVDNCQKGDDHCQEVIVIHKDLVDLLKICEKVLQNKKLAPELLPCQNGFFFGKQDYDEYYFKQIKYTIELIDKILKDEDREYDIYYRSSW